MQFRISARRARGPLAILAILVALPMLPHATGTAAAQTPQTQQAQQPRQVLTLGSGYDRQEGSRRVRQLQIQLNRLGYGAGPADGLFGPLTQAAVLRFQRLQGLTADGIVGPQTRSRLRAARRTAGTVRRGSGYAQPGGSPRVRTVQRQLNRGGYHAGPVDGLFGPRTEAAVLRFQRHEGLAHDGVVGPRTRARLAAAQRTHANGPEKAHNPQNPTTQKPDQGARKAPSAPPAPTATPDEDHGAFPVLAVLIATLGVLALALAARLYRGRGRGRRRRRRLERTAEGSAAEAPWVFEPHPPDSRARPPAPPRGGERAGPEHSAQRPRAWSVGGRRP